MTRICLELKFLPGVVIIEFLYIVVFVALSLTKSYISAESGWKYNQIFHESFKFKGFGGVIFGTPHFSTLLDYGIEIGK